MATQLYDYTAVTMAAYYDVIEMMGDEGLDAMLTAYDLLAVMAAPCTRLDYDHTPFDKRTPLMMAVRLFMSNHPKLTNLTRQGLIRELNRLFLPTLTEERQEEFLSRFRMFEGFDEDGYVIFKSDVYEKYKENMKNMHTKIRYTALASKNATSDLLDKEVTKIYQLQRVGNKSCVDLDITVEDWVAILRGFTPKALALIEAFTKMPDMSATHEQIEKQFGIMSDSINGITAGIGSRAKRIMGIEVLDAAGNSKCWPVPFNNGYDGANGFVWQLRPEVAEAYSIICK